MARDFIDKYQLKILTPGLKPSPESSEYLSIKYRHKPPTWKLARYFSSDTLVH